MLKSLISGNSLALLGDQKYNEGVCVPFFGHDAMTNPAFVQFAQKFDLPLIPAQCIRMNGANFKIKAHPPIATQNRNVEDIISDYHALLEGWITERPEQWLWLHKRWKD